MARGGRRAFLFLAEQRSSDSVLGQATRVRLRASPRARGEVVLKPNGTAHRRWRGARVPSSQAMAFSQKRPSCRP